MLDCCGLCLETGVQTVPAINADSILLKVHLYALGQAHTGQKEVACETEVPVTSSLPPAFVLSCFASLLLSPSGRMQIPKYIVSFYPFFFLMQNYAAACRGLSRLSRLSKLPTAWVAQSTSPLKYTNESILKFLNLWSMSRNTPLLPSYPVCHWHGFCPFIHTKWPSKLVLTSSRLLPHFYPLHHIPSCTPPPEGTPSLSPFFFLVPSNPISLLSPHVPSSPQLLSCYLLPSCAMPQSR